MPLNGAAARYHSQSDNEFDLSYHVIAQPVTTYPANGEDLVAFLLSSSMGGQVKLPSGIKPSNVIINCNLGHIWTYDAVLGTLRNWTAIGATPTEHVTGAYGGNEASAILRLTVFIPQFRSVAL